MSIHRPTATPCPNYTQFPNVFLDYWLGEATDPEWRILCYLVRHTFGYHKNSDAISYKQFMHGVTRADGTPVDKGCRVKSSATLRDALCSLEAKGLIRRSFVDLPGTATLGVYSLAVEDDEPKMPAAASSVDARATSATKVEPLQLVKRATSATKVEPLQLVKRATLVAEVTKENSTKENSKRKEDSADALSRPLTPVQRIVEDAGRLLHWEKVPEPKWKQWAPAASRFIKACGGDVDEALACQAWFLSDPWWQDKASAYSPAKAHGALEDWRAKGKPARVAPSFSSKKKPLDMSGTGPSASVLHDHRLDVHPCPECKWIEGAHDRNCSRRGLR